MHTGGRWLGGLGGDVKSEGVWTPGRVQGLKNARGGLRGALPRLGEDPLFTPLLKPLRTAWLGSAGPHHPPDRSAKV